MLGVSESVALQMYSSALSRLRLRLENILSERNGSMPSAAFSNASYS